MADSTNVHGDTLGNNQFSFAPTSNLAAAADDCALGEDDSSISLAPTDLIPRARLVGQALMMPEQS